MCSLFALLFDAATTVLAASPFWMEAIKHQGLASFNPDKSYQVFRNVKDFGAKGDGVTDDTAAINYAISSGGRCGGSSDCVGTTTTPAVVYFPAGTYLISASVVDYYYTQLIGDPTNLPTLKATRNFKPATIGMLDGDVYTNSGRLKYQSTNVFFRQVRNLIFDTRDFPGPICATHWPSSQATSIQNCIFKLSEAPGAHHTGIFMEEGSGGFLNDLVFYGGEYGAQFGNQQYTMRNLTFFNAKTAILQIWNWGWTYKNINVFNSQVGIDMKGDVIGGVAILDSTFTNTTTGIITGRAPATQKHPGAGSLIIENMVFKDVKDAITGPNGVIIQGNPNGSVVMKGFAYGNLYAPTGPAVYQASDEANFPAITSLMMGDKYYERSKPQYESTPITSFLSARSAGAKGDGRTDDTMALNSLFQKASAKFRDGAVAFLDAGYYKVSDTVYIPPNCRIVGEAMSAAIMGAGPKFSNIDAPRPVVQVGKPGETGYVEWSDTIVSTQGGTAGAKLIEYNLATDTGGCLETGPPSGLWDVHVVVGGFAGSNLQAKQCPKTPEKQNYVNPNCIAGYMSMHITKTASNLYMENDWFWTADHDIEDPNNTQITVFNGRGLHCESEVGRIWLVGTGVEHHTKYQYQFVNTRDIWMGQIQTETPYYQPNPPAPFPFSTVNADLHDPDFSDCNGVGGANNTYYGKSVSSSNFTASVRPATTNLPGNSACAMAWGLRIIGSKSIAIFGAGLYSFFNNYDTRCCQEGNGEYCQARILYVGPPTAKGTVGEGANSTMPSGGAAAATNVDIYNLNTIGSVSMINRQGKDVAFYQDNIAGFTSCIAMFQYLDDLGSIGSGMGLGNDSIAPGAGTGGSGTKPSTSSAGSGATLGAGSSRSDGGMSGYPPGSATSPGSGNGESTSTSRQTASNSGYMCIGDWQQLCNPGGQEAASGTSLPPSGGIPSTGSIAPGTATLAGGLTGGTVGGKGGSDAPAASTTVRSMGSSASPVGGATATTATSQPPPPPRSSSLAVPPGPQTSCTRA